MDVTNITLAVTSIGFATCLLLLFLISQVVELVNSVREYFRGGSLTPILLPTLVLVNFTALACAILRFGFDLSVKNIFAIFLLPPPIALISLVLLMAMMYFMIEIIIAPQLFAGLPRQEKDE